jgi:Poxvirus A32 protein
VLYVYLIGCLDAAGIEHEEFDNLDDVIPCSQYDKSKNNLVIIDDFMSAPKKALEPICDLFTMGRKSGITPIYLAQSYFLGIPQTIRLNVNYLVVMKIKARNDMARILSDVSVDVNKDEMMELLKYIRSLGETNFMLIDKVTNRDDLKLRINFGTF